MKYLKITYKIILFYCIAYSSFAQQAGTLDNSFSWNGDCDYVVVDNEGRPIVSYKDNVNYKDKLYRILPNGITDATYNGGLGYVNSGISIYQMAIQSDNKVLIVGTESFQAAVFRYNSDGTLDNTFSGDGKAYIPSSGTGYESYITEITIQNDGKILVSGGKDNNQFVARFNTNGSLDLSFASNGVFIYSGGVYLGNIVVEGNNKILVLANSKSNLTTYLFRLSPIGSIEAYIPVPTPNNEMLTFSLGMAIQSNGKIVISGFNIFLGLVRLNTDLTLDTSFGSGGWVQYNTSGIADNSLIIQPDQKILLGYSNPSPFYRHTALIRYDSFGNLDPSFAAGGVYSNQDYESRFYRQNDGKIYMSCNGSGAGLKRLHGVTNFESNKGKMITQIGSDNEGGKSIAERPNGKWLVAGYTQNGVSPTSSYDFGLIGYNTDGSLDYSFGSNGIVATDFASNSTDFAYTTVVQADGKILVAGYSASNAITSFAMARYLSNGLLDNSFGTGGKVTSHINGINGGINKISLQSDGKIVAVGWHNSGDFIITRYLTNGSLDNSFGSGGIVSTDFLSGSSDGAVDVFIRSDGKILVAGNAENASGSLFSIARYNANGSLDTSFDGDGKFTTTVGGVYDYLTSMAVQPDNKIVLVGTASNGTNNNCGIIRILENGGLDNTFDADGKKVIVIGGSGYDDYTNSVAVRPDGKILIGGNITSNISSTMFLLRFNTNGSLDTNFDSDGKYFTKIGYLNEELYAIKALSTKILVAGSYNNGLNNDFAFLSVSNCSVSDEIISSPYVSSSAQVEGKTILATNQISNASNVTYKSSDYVILSPGFQVSNSVFKAEIGGCQ